MKQVVHYIKGSSKSQSFYAGKLGTTSSSGSALNKIKDVLRTYTGKNYIQAKTGTFTTWNNRVKGSVNNKMPAVLNIRTTGISSIPYNSDGHFVNTSGYSTAGEHWRVRITDPWGPGLGNKWYPGGDLYTANCNSVTGSLVF